MKKRIFIFVCTVVFVSFVGCREDNFYSTLEDVLMERLREDIERYDYLILIPGSGCSGCITNAEEFFHKNINNERIGFILTNNFSRKGLQLRLGRENLERENVIIDNENLFYLSKYQERIYPMAISIERGKVTSIRNLDEILTY